MRAANCTPLSRHRLEGPGDEFSLGERNGIGWIDRNRHIGAAAGRLAVVAVAIELRRRFTTELQLNATTQACDVNRFQGSSSSVVGSDPVDVTPIHASTNCWWEVNVVRPALQAVRRRLPSLGESLFFRALHGRQSSSDALARCSLCCHLAARTSLPRP